MTEQQTVTTHFLHEVLAGLSATAADSTARAADVVEAPAAVVLPKSEHQRLLLLADRIVRVWAARAVATLHAEDLNVIAARHPRVHDRHDAGDAAQALASLIALVEARPDSGLAATPRQVADALEQMQRALSSVALSAPTDPQSTSATAALHAARGLRGAHDVGGISGLPTEAAATVAVLQTLNPDYARDLGGAQMPERGEIASEIHHQLLGSLVRSFVDSRGTITHGGTTGTRPDPPRVGRHRPDVVSRTFAGEPLIGLAKLGPDLFDTYTQEQLADFSSYTPDSYEVSFTLIVPGGWCAEARRAARHAGDMTNRTNIRELSGIVGAPTPST